MKEAKNENKRWEEAYAELERERNDLERKVEPLRSQIETLKGDEPVAEFNPLEVAERYKLFKAKHPKSKATYSDFLKFLEMG